MLIREQLLHDRAQRCRVLADTAVTEEARLILFELAQRYEREASSDTIEGEPVGLSETAA